ncbi:hypothetical protein DV872_12095 [Oceanispirochaeta sp. M1]|nr:hypothetical protein DV872_12095 [Oceanispirochaeta sp. M1]
MESLCLRDNKIMTCRNAWNRRPFRIYQLGNLGGKNKVNKVQKNRMDNIFAFCNKDSYTV